MDKYAQILELVKEAAVALRSQASEIRDLRNKLAQIEISDDAGRLADELRSKGMDGDVPTSKLAEHLAGIAMSDFDAYNGIKQAVAMAGPNMGQAIASVDGTERSTVGSRELERFIAS